MAIQITPLPYNTNTIELMIGKNDENPIASGNSPIFVVDLWDHAYYPNVAKFPRSGSLPRHVLKMPIHSLCIQLEKI